LSLARIGQLGAAYSRYGIPDVELPKAGGGTVNPADFVGHEVIVLFCPTDPETAERDVAEYGLHLNDYCESDAWIIGICDKERPSCTHPEDSLTMALDGQRLAWRVFQDLLKRGRQTPREQGAVFLFDRGGGFRRSWAGSGHAADVARAVRERR
jgi:peroxiredoxin